ncbi:MAG: hypothetical protein RR477_06490 [Raoultibacter sp.]
MSQLNSEPRSSLMGMSPVAMLKAANAHAAEILIDALGVEEVSYDKLNLKVDAINQSRKNRGLQPLI